MRPFLRTAYRLRGGSAALLRTASSSKATLRAGWGIAGTAESLAAVESVETTYHDAHERALFRLSQPIPAPEVADDLTPDFVIGVLDYKYSLRARWREALGQALGLPDVTAVQLSIAWHGRLPDDFNRGVSKVVGVTLVASKHQSCDVDGLVEGINARRILPLLELSIVKAGPGSLITRQQSGQPGLSVAWALKTLCGNRAAVCFCTKADLPWVRDVCAQRALSARVDLHAVVVDADDGDEVVSQSASGTVGSIMRQLVDEYARARRALPTSDGSGRLVMVGDVVPFTDVVRTPALCVNGTLMATGEAMIAELLKSTKRFRRMVHEPHRLSVGSAKVL